MGLPRATSGLPGCRIPQGQGRERRLRVEKAIDLLNARFGSGTVGPAASYRQAG